MHYELDNLQTLNLKSLTTPYPPLPYPTHKLSNPTIGRNIDPKGFITIVMKSTFLTIVANHQKFCLCWMMNLPPTYLTPMEPKIVPVPKFLHPQNLTLPMFTFPCKQCKASLRPMPSTFMAQFLANK